MQTRIPCVFMRGGTSRGPFFHARDLPEDAATRDRVLLAVMGSPDVRQIDGIGGADPLTSKVAILSKSTRPGIDIDYLFAQVKIAEAAVDTSPNCGNMLSGVGPFAIEEGLVAAADPETAVRIHNVNTGVATEAIVQTPGGRVTYDGDCAIDGVPGTAAPVKLNFLNAEGSKTGKLLPTGRPKDVIDGIEVSCVDFAMPIVFFAARALGKTGYETAAELEADQELIARFEAIRRQAGALMGLGDVAGRVIPKVVLAAPPRAGGTVTGRYFTPDRAHKAYAVTGSICTALAAAIPGTVLAPLARVPAGNPKPMTIEHPSGRFDVEMDISGDPLRPTIRRAALLRTCRRLFEGRVLIPARVWTSRQGLAEATQ
ncbi:MAG: 4-oxalomesaconate tautomerase [Proteobacteria bacterium]|nr:4-oxalomesaconate tautomerase [Pseudomonadota bacterium]